MISLQMRLMFLVGLLFAIVYGIVVMIGTYLGMQNFLGYAIVACIFMLVQYLVSPKIVEWTMRVRYISRQEEPRIFQMVESLARSAGIPAPRIGIAQIAIPNAFAFGRSIRDGRICVTQGLINLLSDEELKAVLGHEMTHLKSRDMVTISLLSVIPMIMYFIYLRFAFSGYRRNDRGSNAVAIGMVALLFYYITNLLVLYGSRVREYFADRGAVRLGNKPSSLASALYKLSYGAAHTRPEAIQEVQGLKAFFASDPSLASHEVSQISFLDRDKNGTLDPSELLLLRNKRVRISGAEAFIEFFSTHPNMLKRIKQLSEYAV